MKKGYLYIIVTIVMFTSYEVVLRYIAGQINSMQLTLCRFSVGFLILLPLALRTLKRRGKRLDGRSMARFALLGLLGIALSMPILHLSVRYAGSSVAAVLFSCNPVFVTFLAFFLLKEPIKPRHISALALEIAGTVAIIDPLGHALNPLGVGLALLSTLLFSLYGVLGKRRVAEYGGAVVTCFSFLFGSLIVLGLILLSHVPAVARDDGRRSGGVRPHPHPGGVHPGKPALRSVCVRGGGGDRLLLLLPRHGAAPRQRGLPGLLFQACAGPGAGLAAPRRGDPRQHDGRDPAHRGGLPVHHHSRASGRAPEAAGVRAGDRSRNAAHIHTKE